MLQRRAQYLIWKRQVFLRNPHSDLNQLYSAVRGTSGIYLIGCAAEIVYVGQSWDLEERPFESLGRFYHRELDVSLPWSLALAPCATNEMNERESTAIRAFAPKYNTSIPSIPACEGRLPEIMGHAMVFQDQVGSGGAFDPESLERQIERAMNNVAPPWRRGKQRRKTGKSVPKPDPATFDLPFQLSGTDLQKCWQLYGVPSGGSLIYPINLCDDGSVVTRDGEYIGTWGMDQYHFPSFTPEGDTRHLIEDPSVGLLCMSIRNWFEGNPSGSS